MLLSFGNPRIYNSTTLRSASEVHNATPMRVASVASCSVKASGLSCRTQSMIKICFKGRCDDLPFGHPAMPPAPFRALVGSIGRTGHGCQGQTRGHLGLRQGPRSVRWHVMGVAFLSNVFSDTTGGSRPATEPPGRPLAGLRCVLERTSGRPPANRGMMVATSDRRLANGASGVNPVEGEVAENANQWEADRFSPSSALWGVPRGGKNPKSRREASVVTPTAPKANEKE